MRKSRLGAKPNGCWLTDFARSIDTALNDLVRESYLAAYSVLEKTYRARKERYEDEIKSAETEAESENASQQLMYADHRWSEQTQALTAMILGLLASENKSFLDELKRMFNIVRPPDPKGYPGKSQLQRQITEYGSRFGIDLEKINAFETVREVGLARDCCVHNDGVPTTEYREQTRQRVIGFDGRIDITPQLLDELILEISRFSRDLSVQLKTVREMIMPTA